MAKAKHWVVTGASRGIGLAIVTELLRQGEQVTALARNVGKAEKLQQLRLDDPARLRLLECDVTKDIDVDRAAKELSGITIDVLVNNAGVYIDDKSSFSDLDAKVLEQTFNVNVAGPFRVTRAFFSSLEKSSEPRIANITSQMGSIADNSSGGAYAYRISKAGLNMFTKTLSLDLKAGIVLSLHPGWVKTDMGGTGAPTEKNESAAGLIKVIRNAQPKDSGHFYNFKGEAIPW